MDDLHDVALLHDEGNAVEQFQEPGRRSPRQTLVDGLPGELHPRVVPEALKADQLPEVLLGREAAQHADDQASPKGSHLS